LSKGKWLQEIGVDVDWPMYGIRYRGKIRSESVIARK
jgi:hypothetical protein